MDVFFLWGDTIGGATVLFLGVPRGLLGVPFFQFLGVPGPDWGCHDLHFMFFLGVPLFDWGSHKNMKIWKMFFELIFFRENDEVLKLVLKHVFSIHNDKLSIWDIFTKIFSFFWKESVFQNFQQISWTTFLRFCDPKYFSYQKMIIIIF